MTNFVLANIRIWTIPGLFSVLFLFFSHFNNKFIVNVNYLNRKNSRSRYLKFEPRAAGSWTQTDPLTYGSHLLFDMFVNVKCNVMTIKVQVPTVTERTVY